MSANPVITGMGAICAAGSEPERIWETLRAGRSAIAPIRYWGACAAALPAAGEYAEFNARDLVEDRKIHKWLRRSDFLGLYAARRALESSELVSYRDSLETPDYFNDRSGIFVGSGAAYQDQYDFLPLMAAAGDDLAAFGRELTNTVNPMWLLQSLPNNVLCHLGIRWGFKGANACITNHSASGALALLEAAAALSAGESDRVLVVAHESPIEPESIVYYRALGLTGDDAPRPFDAARSGSLLGEGAAAMVMETLEAASARGASILGEVLGGACTSEAEGLLALRADGDGLARAIALALDGGGIRAADVGLIVAHGNGTRQSDPSEARAIRRIFGGRTPPVTATKWAIGHTLAASAMLDAVLALLSLRRGEAFGIGSLEEVDPECVGLLLSREAQPVSSDVALVLCRGFAGLSVALLVRAPRDAAP